MLVSVASVLLPPAKNLTILHQNISLLFPLIPLFFFFLSNHLRTFFLILSRPLFLFATISFTSICNVFPSTVRSSLSTLFAHQPLVSVIRLILVFYFLLITIFSFTQSDSLPFLILLSLICICPPNFLFCFYSLQPVQQILDGSLRNLFFTSKVSVRPLSLVMDL